MTYDDLIDKAITRPYSIERSKAHNFPSLKNSRPDPQRIHRSS